MEPPLSVHTGIASGQVVASRMGSEGHREYTVTGDSVNLASRLTDLAGPGETYASAVVARGLGDRLAATFLGPRPIEGLPEPVEVWRIDGMVAADRFAPATAFVGRGSEQARFAEIADRCFVGATGETILLRGEAGIGKTRLLQEFTELARQRGFDSCGGLVLDFGAGKGQDAISALVRELLELPADGGGTAVEQQVEQQVEQAVASGLLADERRMHLYDLLDLPQPDDLRALFEAMDNETRRLGRQETLCELVTGQSARRPLLLRIEDMHWASASVLAHAGALAREVAACSALLVLTTRVAGDPFDAEWRAQTGTAPLLDLDLAPLQATEAAGLASEFSDLDDGLVTTCIARAGGQPAVSGAVAAQCR